MKTNSIVIAVLLLLAFVTAKSQDHAVNFWTPKTVVLYRGIENPLAINLCGLELKDLQITASDGAQILNKEGKISVFVPVDFEKDELIITVEHQQGVHSDNTTINHLKVRDIPTPIVSLGNLGSVKRSFAKEEILSNLSFTIIPPDYFPYEVSYKIISYEFLIVNKGVTTVITAHGDKISDEFIEMIKNANEPVHRIGFTNLVLEGPGGKTVKTGFGIEIFNGWEE
jgi:hypothetical protein